MDTSNRLWAKIIFKKFRQPFVVVTSLIPGSYPDIVEPYPSGPNVTIIVSSPNVTTFIPRECCTAALPIVIDVTPPVPNTVNEGVGEDALPPIGTIPPVETSPPTVSQRHERIHAWI
jgi:hypothetical protein